METKGLISIFTGDGKGKTTSSLGLMLRATGHGHKVCVIQFIKGGWASGEQKAVECFGDLVDFHTMGKGFTWKSENIDEDIKLAKKAWDFAKNVIIQNNYQMVILDELTYLLKYKMVAEEDVLLCLLNKPENLHVVITGRDAADSLCEIADLVTEMKAIKHPYKKGIKAQKGFEY